MNMFIPFRENPGSEELYISYSEIGDVVDTVRKAAAKAGLTFYWYSPTPFCHYNPIAQGLGNKSCAAMDGLISVDYDGSVLPCSSYSMNMGNLLEKPFADVWFSKRAAFFKQKKYAPSECEECPSFTACQAACPLYWEYAGCAEIKNPAGYREKRKVL